MVFSSLVFLFAYLPLTLLCYYVVPRKWRNLVLFVVSLAFYGWGEPIYILLMLASVTMAYGFGFFIEKYRETDQKRAKRMMILSIAVNLSFLLFFKYYNFFAANLSLLPLIHIPTIEGLRLPIGISFYTFQIISYTIDLYRRDCKLQKNYIAFGTYVSLFPQLIAGPIVRYHDVDEQLSGRRETVTDFSLGIRRFCCGLAKKILLGDTLALGYEYYKAMAEVEPTALGGWMTIILYTLHLYYDFSGYSDMAIGLGKMFGFHFPENFNYPYISKSISEFWRRWHISLSTWFREYVYIPLGGNRVGKWKLYRNLSIVWLLTGFWHGANWNFVLWGVYFAVILIAERAFLSKWLEKLPAVLRHVYAMLLVTVGFLIFSFTDASEGIACLASLVGIGCVGFSSSVASYQLLHLLPLILIAAIGATPIPKKLTERLVARYPKCELVFPILCFAALLLSVAYMADSAFSPFEYLNF
ncbi:MAG: MBOAT family protein [Clostridia bacterium]|nr:MBOAT family protein [Clostridia bacterium]